MDWQRCVICIENGGDLNPWSLGGSFMAQKMAITFPSPSFKG